MIENNQEVVDKVSRDKDDEDNNVKLDAANFTRAFTFNGEWCTTGIHYLRSNVKHCHHWVMF